MKKLILILIVLGFFTYLPSLFGQFIWDDEDLVYQNQYVANFQIGKIFTESSGSGRGKLSTYYRPLQLLLFAIIHKFFGFSPFFYHLNSIIWHILASILIFYFLNSLLNNYLLSFFTSLFFLIHPVQTESVSYVAGLNDPMFVSFMFLSLIFFLKKEEKNYYWLVSLLFFIISFLAKELGLLTVGFMFLMDFFFRREKIRHNIGYFFIFWFVGSFLLILRLTVFNFVDSSLIWQGSVYGQNVFIRLATFFKNFFLYLSLLIFPKDLYMERSQNIKIVDNILSVWTFYFFIFNFLILVFIFLLNKKRKIDGRLTLFFWLCFLFSFSPFCGLVLINDVFYEHFLYLPMVFFWGFIFSLLASLLENKFFKTMVVLVVFLLIVRSYFRQYEWIDNVRFYQQTLKHAPKSVRVINNLGMELTGRGRIEEAIETYKKGIKIDPLLPNLYHNLANTYLKKKDFEKAEKYYLQAIKVDPNFYFSYFSLVDLYLKKGEKEKAKEFLEKEAIPKFPDNQKLKEWYLFLNQSQ